MRSDNSPRDLERVFSVIIARSTLFTEQEDTSRPSRNLVSGRRQGGGGKTGKRRTKESFSRRAMITRCNRYKLGPGVADTAIYVRVYTVDG